MTLCKCGQPLPPNRPMCVECREDVLRDIKRKLTVKEQQSQWNKDRDKYVEDVNQANKHKTRAEIMAGFGEARKRQRARFGG